MSLTQRLGKRGRFEIASTMEILGIMPTNDIDYSNEMVLVVDDDEAARDVIAEMLTFLGFKVHAVASGREALENLKKKPYSFMLTDMKMPEMDGFELIRQVKYNYPHVCTIAMTGYSEEYKYVDVINAGTTDFIDKPVEIEELEAKIRRAIIDRNIREELSRLSITDSLTALYNQRHFFDRLGDEIIRARRQKKQLGLIILDLDYFKKYNDNHGHLAGDEILQKVGEIIKAGIRQGVDSGYRYGGDEFAIIVVDAGRDIAERIGARVGSNIEQECGLSAATGYASLSEGMTTEMLVAEADKHMYESKGAKKR